MNAEVVLSAKHYLDEAQNRLEKRELIKFISSISNAILLAKSEVTDPDILAKSTYIKAKGLIDFHQYEEALDAINEALIYNQGDRVIALKKRKGIAKGYLGNVREAREIFAELLNQTEKPELLIGIYLNLLWVSLTLEKDKSPELMQEARGYLNNLGEYYHTMSDRRKAAYLQWESLYHFYMDEHEEAMKVLKSSIEFCPEQELANTYVNLAEYNYEFYEDIMVEEAREYLKKAEAVATQYNDYLVLGHTFFTQAKFEVREGNPFTALDSLYLALAHFKEANAHLQYLECLEKINEIEVQCKNEWLTALMKKIKDSPEKVTINKMKIKEDAL